jgi:hypothetical protein
MSIADTIGTWLSGTVTKATDQSTTNLQEKLNTTAIAAGAIALFVVFIAFVLWRRK